MNLDGLSGMTPSEMAAVAQFELFTNLVKAGFTERQALFLVAEMIAAHIRDKKE